MTPPITEPGLARRLLWFVLLWCGGVLVVGSVALVLRLPLKYFG